MLLWRLFILLSFLIDGINLITLHIYGFIIVQQKIYRRQLEIIKSLFQLFRGKKYNVLRNRIDNLNNYIITIIIIIILLL